MTWAGKDLIECNILDPNSELEKKIADLYDMRLFVPRMTAQQEETIVQNFVSRLESEYRLEEKPSEIPSDLNKKTFLAHTREGKNILVTDKGNDITRILGLEHARAVAAQNNLAIKVPKKFVYRDPHLNKVTLEREPAFSWLDSKDYRVYSQYIESSEEPITLQEAKDIEIFVRKGGFMDFGDPGQGSANFIKGKDGIYLIDTEDKTFTTPIYQTDLERIFALGRYRLTNEAKAWLDEYRINFEEHQKVFLLEQEKDKNLYLQYLKDKKVHQDKPKKFEVQVPVGSRKPL
jgi:hypothetical protein